MAEQTVFDVRKGKNDVMYARKMTKQQQRQRHYSKHLKSKSKSRCWIAPLICHPAVLGCKPAASHPKAALTSRQITTYPVSSPTITHHPHQSVQTQKLAQIRLPTPTDTNFKPSKLYESSNAKACKGKINKKGKKY